MDRLAPASWSRLAAPNNYPSSHLVGSLPPYSPEEGTTMLRIFAKNFLMASLAGCITLYLQPSISTITLATIITTIAGLFTLYDGWIAVRAAPNPPK